MDSTIASHAVFAYGLHPTDASARARVCRSLAARMATNQTAVADMIDYTNGSDLFEAVRSIAEQIQRLADYIAEGEEGAQ